VLVENLATALDSLSHPDDTWAPGAAHEAQGRCGMELHLMRHGSAGRRQTDPQADDRVRPLTMKSLAFVRRVARGPARRRLVAGRVLCSPFTHARQTAEAAAEVIDIEAS